LVLKESYLSFEFHISKRARDFYQFDKGIYGLSGNVIFTNFYAVRLLAQRMNERRDLIANPERAVRVSQVNAMGLIDEILHYVCSRYRKDENPKVMKKALNWLNAKFTSEMVNATLIKFIEEFPPLAVYQGKESPQVYFNGETEGMSNREIILEEMILLYLANNNPAFSFFSELFDDSTLKETTLYSQGINSLIDFFRKEVGFGVNKEALIDMLQTPVKASPHSLSGQLIYIKDHWAYLLPKEFLIRILLALDLIKEEESFHRMGGPAPLLVLDFKSSDIGIGPEYERFSPDADWMPRTVLIAKNVYVWLYQLSKKYNRSIQTLDQIPDEELDMLSRWGFTGLWLIGLWERSPASQKIKHISGNPEAISSAYSIYDYVIAQELGGEESLINLRTRAAERGIRLAADMVPNHMGIYSKWTIEHPDWFIQLHYSPFPSYRFTGVNLSSDARVGIYIEDGYWRRTDAAVVFMWVDHLTGEIRYIYHGNDGTYMPWNDTAQLNFLLPHVREAVIQTILHVAKLFPIIRFDAAMTLTKRHYQRLWFPQPGDGGAIPSRAEYGMSKDEFNRVFPTEFWRDVVDRVAQEVPGTLLIAEAFWLMEGYFVRTLGMHRVYNSAFMNMLKMEENAKYRSLIKNILEFDPEILKRFVNFMNNPDEDTAVAQFGKDDKYFGVCLMMVTMPGLPMFGHGQIEGFTEKYGMEYRRSYWEEGVDWNLVHRHEMEIFPLMRKRYLFAEVENFVLYDFYREHGTVDENVFCYSNRYKDERALIVYHNKFATTNGWIRTSAAIAVKDSQGHKRLIQKTLAEGLRLKGDDSYYYIFRDYKSNLEYIRQGKEIVEKGLYVELGAYKYHIFLDWREVYDQNGYYANLWKFLNGQGVASIEEAGRNLYLQPIHIPFKEIVNPYFLRELGKLMKEEVTLAMREELLDSFEEKIQNLLRAIREFPGGEAKVKSFPHQSQRLFLTILRLKKLDSLYKWPDSAQYHPVIEYLYSYMPRSLNNSLNYWRILLIWQVVYGLGRSKIDEWMLGTLIRAAIANLGTDEWIAYREEFLIKILTDYYTKLTFQPFPLPKGMGVYLKEILKDPDILDYIHLNRYEGVLYFHKESFEELIYWLFVVSIIDIIAKSTDEKTIPPRIMYCYEVAQQLIHTAQDSGYRLEEMLKIQD